MPGSELSWLSRHCVDAAVLLLAVTVGLPLVLLWVLWRGASRLLFLLKKNKRNGTSSRPERRVAASNGTSAAAEHAKLS